MSKVLITPPPFSNGRFHLGNAISAVYVDVVARDLIRKGEKVVYRQNSYNNQSTIIDRYASERGAKTLSEIKRVGKMIVDELNVRADQEKAVLGLLDLGFEFRDDSPNIQSESQRKFLSLLERGYITRQERTFYLDIKKIRKSIDLDGILSQISIVPGRIRPRIIALYNQLDGFGLSKSRFYATPLPLWLCKCGAVIQPNQTTPHVDPRVDKMSCPSCSTLVINQDNLAINPLFDLSLISFYMEGSPAELQVNGEGTVYKWNLLEFLIMAVLTGQPFTRNLIVHSHLFDLSGKPFSKYNPNTPRLEELAEKEFPDLPRFVSLKAFKKVDKTTYQPSWEKEGKRFFIKLKNLRRFINQLPQSRNGTESLLDLDILQNLDKNLSNYYIDFALNCLEDITYSFSSEIQRRKEEIFKGPKNFSLRSDMNIIEDYVKVFFPRSY